jgi:GDP-D-mannose 3', 5'-epimerase
MAASQSTYGGMATPRGVAGGNTENTFIKKSLGWEPSTTLNVGLRDTYNWIKEQYQKRKQGKHVVE